MPDYRVDASGGEVDDVEEEEDETCFWGDAVAAACVGEDEVEEEEDEV